MLTAVTYAPSWEAYDKRKTLIKEDPSIFCPEQLWEFNYLLDNIVNAQPQLDPIMVMLAMRQTMRETLAPRPRVFFVQAVMESINERQNQWAQILNGSEQKAS